MNQQQTLFMFSPDGGTRVFTFAPNGRAISFLIGAVLCVLVCISLALVELAHIAMSAINFLLTANGDTLTRLGSFALFLTLMMFSVVLLKYLRLRSATASVGAHA